MERFVRRLSPEGGEQAREVIAEAEDAAAEGWASIRSGGASQRRPTEADRSPGGDLVPDAGTEDYVLFTHAEVVKALDDIRDARRWADDFMARDPNPPPMPPLPEEEMPEAPPNAAA